MAALPNHGPIGKRAAALQALRDRAVAYGENAPPDELSVVSEREEYFLDDMRERLAQYGKGAWVSPRQLRWLEHIEARLDGAGAPKTEPRLKPLPAARPRTVPVRAAPPPEPEPATPPRPRAELIAELDALAAGGNKLAAAFRRYVATVDELPPPQADQVASGEAT